MSVEKTNFSQKSEDIISIYISREEVVERLAAESIPLTRINDNYLSDILKGSSVYSWGRGGPILGLNSDTSSIITLTQIGNYSDWYQIEMGNAHCLATKTDSTLWAWGSEELGILGLNSTTINRSSPVQVGSLKNWRQISAGFNHSLTTKTDGTLWSWGRNLSGQLGLNTSADVSSPVQVGALTDWNVISAGTSFSQSIKTNGTLWSWGAGTNGVLGLNSVVAVSSPVQVGALTNWKQISNGVAHCLSVKSDGTLWSWGSESFGRLGLNSTTVDRSSPVQVGALTNWKLISAGRYHSLSIKTDGTLWTWGRNNLGQLGLGNAVDVSSPVQIGSTTDWKEISVTDLSSLAIKTNGTMWSWGRNEFGQLGLGSVISFSSPVQVGVLTNWYKISSGSNTNISLLRV